MTECAQPDAWIVESVDPNEDGTSAVVHLAQNTTYEPDRTQDWPESKQQLVVKVDPR